MVMRKRRKTVYLDHNMRRKKFKLLRTIIECKVEGERGISRKKKRLRNIRRRTGLHIIESIKHTAKRVWNSGKYGSEYREACEEEEEKMY